GAGGGECRGRRDRRAGPRFPADAGEDRPGVPRGRAQGLSGVEWGATTREARMPERPKAEIEPAQLRCGGATMRLLRDYGVDTVFGIPGFHTLEFYRGLGQSGIRHVLTRNEQGAGFMAD